MNLDTHTRTHTPTNLPSQVLCRPCVFVREKQRQGDRERERVAAVTAFISFPAKASVPGMIPIRAWIFFELGSSKKSSRILLTLVPCKSSLDVRAWWTKTDCCVAAVHSYCILRVTAKDE